MTATFPAAPSTPSPGTGHPQRQPAIRGTVSIFDAEDIEMLARVT